MRIRMTGSRFEACPEFTGRAVCVDVTPLRKQQSQYGERDVFKVVFEVDIEKADGSRYCVWSKHFTPSLNEKANFRKFLRSWLGRDLTESELKEFDTESLVGKAAHLVVVQEQKDGEVYANIVACTPAKGEEPLVASGGYVRVQDRQGTPGASGYRRMDQPRLGSEAGGQRSEGSEHAAVKVHVGRCKGLELRDLAPEQVEALIEHWLPGAKENPKPLADDRRLMAALEWWQNEQEKAADNVPY